MALQILAEATASVCLSVATTLVGESYLRLTPTCQICMALFILLAELSFVPQHTNVMHRSVRVWALLNRSSSG
ncbi:hypothetical protein DPMN_051194 [Dreissena polymorpha]|uniref:Uncharacterized protein n=1 Tax=Dreissena polymorpha TaxID=45954 RepID=A0A9D4CJI6_DREPO|nr:hypothetical protein DPMN_051194 [Dreissena polymorpha]